MRELRWRREKEQGKGREVNLGMPLLVLDGAFYRLTNGFPLLTLMKRVVKNNQVEPWMWP